LGNDATDDECEAQAADSDPLLDSEVTSRPIDTAHGHVSGGPGPSDGQCPRAWVSVRPRRMHHCPAATGLGFGFAVGGPKSPHVNPGRGRFSQTKRRVLLRLQVTAVRMAEDTGTTLPAAAAGATAAEEEGEEEEARRNKV
jgi:hypothetical protein